MLTLSITALLASGLLVAGGGLVEDQRRATTQDAMEVVGQQVGSRLAAADRLVAAGATEVTVRGTFPETLTGSSYAIEIDPGSPTTLTLTARSVDASVTVSVATNATVAAGTVSGGDVAIVYAGGALEVRSR
uniref:DUF7266 family protein n=1 Tax=Halobaculum gomorrense TaxID=43928 RepID=UPI0009329FF5|nr:hypothetical protein [Halobaculum gomorrense]